MFGIAFITGVAKTGRPSIATIAVLVSLSLFLMSKAPLSAYLKRKKSGMVLPLAIYIIAGSAGCLYSVLMQPGLIALYFAGIILIALYFILMRKGMPVLSEASGMAVMGLVAAISASIGSDVRSSLYLWIMFFLFYLASSFRVRFIIMKYRIASGVYAGVIVAGSVVLAFTGRLIFLSFLPLIEDIFASIAPKNEDFKKLGIIETIKSIVFGLGVILFGN